MDNPRFVQFMRLYEHVEFKNNIMRNCEFMSFISDMVTLYTGASGILDPKRQVSNHEEFTKFIEKYVDEQLEN